MSEPLILTDHQAEIVLAALIMVRDNTPEMPRQDMVLLRWVIDCMSMEGVDIALLQRERS